MKKVFLTFAVLFTSQLAFAELLDVVELESLKQNGNALICRTAPDDINSQLLQANKVTGKKVQIRNIISTAEHRTCILLATVDK